jgi:hypothetical protein
MPASPRPGPLAEAAAALEADLRAFEAAVADAAHVKLDTRKNLERCARDVQRAAALYEGMNARIGDLSRELNAAQQRALSAATQLRDLGLDLQGKQDGYVQRVTAYEELMAEANTIGELTKQGPDALPEVRTRLLALAERSREMAAAAREAGFRDLAEEATGRQQQLTALANKLGG